MFCKSILDARAVLVSWLSCFVESAWKNCFKISSSKCLLFSYFYLTFLFCFLSWVFDIKKNAFLVNYLYIDVLKIILPISYKLAIFFFVYVLGYFSYLRFYFCIFFYSIMIMCKCSIYYPISTFLFFGGNCFIHYYTVLSYFQTFLSVCVQN